MVIEDFNNPVTVRDTVDGSIFVMTNIGNNHIIVARVSDDPLIKPGQGLGQGGHVGYITEYNEFKRWLLENPDILCRVKYG